MNFWEYADRHEALIGFVALVAGILVLGVPVAVALIGEEFLQWRFRERKEDKERAAENLRLRDEADRADRVRLAEIERQEKQVAREMDLRREEMKRAEDRGGAA